MGSALRAIWALALLSLIPQLASGRDEGTIDPCPDEYLVYNAVIERTYIRPGIKRVVVDDRTPFPYDSSKVDIPRETDWMMKGFAPVSIEPETVASYFAANRKPSRIHNHFTLSVPVILYDLEARDSFSRFVKNRDFWTAFYHRYPHSSGILALSRVGFNRTEEQALVYVRSSCGSLCGAGEYYLLSRKGGIWRVEARFLVEVS